MTVTPAARWTVGVRRVFRALERRVRVCLAPIRWRRTRFAVEASPTRWSITTPTAMRYSLNRSHSSRSCRVYKGASTLFVLPLFVSYTCHGCIILVNNLHTSAMYDDAQSHLHALDACMMIFWRAYIYAPQTKNFEGRTKLAYVF